MYGRFADSGLILSHIKGQCKILRVNVRYCSIVGYCRYTNVVYDTYSIHGRDYGLIMFLPLLQKPEILALQGSS